MFRTLTLEVYKLTSKDVQLLVEYFKGVWNVMNYPDRVFDVLQTYLETFETTERLLEGYPGHTFDLTEPDGLWYCLKGKVENASKVGLNSDPDFELVGQVVHAIEAFQEDGGSTLVAILKGLSLFDSEFNYWLNVDRALVEAMQQGIIVENNGKYTLKRTKTKKK